MLHCQLKVLPVFDRLIQIHGLTVPQRLHNQYRCRLVWIGLLGLSSNFFRMTFLDQYERRPFTLADTGSLKPAWLYLGKGPSAVEVVTLESSSRPTVTALPTAWKARLARRATPLLTCTRNRKSDWSAG
jgi:hypothetical protein